MWLTTVTYDLVGIRESDPGITLPIFQSIGVKRNELAATDGSGNGVEGFRAPDSFDNIDPTITTVVVKRLWNTELAAQEFANFADAASEHITVTVEEQV